MTERRNQLSSTRVALSTGGHARKQVLISFRVTKGCRLLASVLCDLESSKKKGSSVVTGLDLINS